MVFGPEFGEDAGKSAVTVRALYGLKSVGASFKAHLVHCMQKLQYQSYDAELDLWMKAQYRPDDKLQYYSYILCYVDDILCIHHSPDDVLNELNDNVPLKPGSVGSPNMYLGTKLKCMQLHNGIWAWSMSPSKYIQEAIRICKEYIIKQVSKGYKLPKRADNPKSVYSPEMDVSPLLRPDEASDY